MKQFKVFIGILLLSAGAVGCSSTFRAATGYASDDLYAVHDRAEIARRQQAEAEAQRAAAEARKAEWEARIAEAEAAAAENRYYEYTSPDANPYESILADDYESAYARRLRGFESPTYKMPSSYLDARYSSAFTYASAYDPAFYNIIISGDQVWVEPKYITSMFGTWGGTVLWDPWYYGWTRPWGPSFAFGSWGWSVGWNAWYNPWYYGWYGAWGPWGPWYASWYDPWWGPAWGWAPDGTVITTPIGPEVTDPHAPITGAWCGGRIPTRRLPDSATGRDSVTGQPLRMLLLRAGTAGNAPISESGITTVPATTTIPAARTATAAIRGTTITTVAATASTGGTAPRSIGVPRPRSAAEAVPEPGLRAAVRAMRVDGDEWMQKRWV